MAHSPIAKSPKESPALLGEQEIQFVCNLAEHAGNLAASMRASVGVHQKTGPHDLVTDADLAVSNLLMRELAGRFPNDFFISEEEALAEGIKKHLGSTVQRTWLIDPIDGTDNYVHGDGQYSVMIGLLVNGIPHFGCVASPAMQMTYYGGPAYGSWCRHQGGKAERFGIDPADPLGTPVRLMMGWRDRRNNPWILNMAGVKIIAAGSVGLKVAKVIADEADVFVHLSGKLKFWDTAGPAAIALGAGLEVGTFDADQLDFPLPEIRHKTTVVMGRPGTLEWSRRILGKQFIV